MDKQEVEELKKYFRNRYCCFCGKEFQVGEKGQIPCKCLDEKGCRVLPVGEKLEEIKYCSGCHNKLVLKEIEPNKYDKICPKCYWSWGIISSGIPLHMDGDERHKNKNIIEGNKLCLECEGTGNMFLSMFKKCDACTGTGIYNNDYNYSKDKDE